MVVFTDLIGTLIEDLFFWIFSTFCKQFMFVPFSILRATMGASNIFTGRGVGHWPMAIVALKNWITNKKRCFLGAFWGPGEHFEWPESLSPRWSVLTMHCNGNNHFMEPNLSKLLKIYHQSHHKVLLLLIVNIQLRENGTFLRAKLAMRIGIMSPLSSCKNNGTFFRSRILQCWQSGARIISLIDYK